MKKLLSLMAAVTLLAAGARADRVYINDFTIKAGETMTVELMLDNERTYKPMQADFDFPEGLAIVCDENNRPVFTATDRTATHIIRGSRPQGTGDNHYRIGMLATASAITPGDGAIATFQVVADEDFVGDFTIELTEINVGDENYVNYVLDNTSCSVTGQRVKFLVTIVETEGGTVTADVDEAREGDTVTLTVTPDDGYLLEALSVEDNSGASGAAPAPRRAPVQYGLVDDLYTFAMPAADVIVTATFVKESLTGIDAIGDGTAADGGRYNLLGQPVGDDYRGIVIERRGGKGAVRVVK